MPSNVLEGGGEVTIQPAQVDEVWRVWKQLVYETAVWRIRRCTKREESREDKAALKESEEESNRSQKKEEPAKPTVAFRRKTEAAGEEGRY